MEVLSGVYIVDQFISHFRIVGRVFIYHWKRYKASVTDM